MKEIGKLLMLELAVILLAATSPFNAQVQSRRAPADQMIQFFRDVKVEDIQEHSLIISFTTAAPASVHVSIESLDKTPIEEKLRRGTYWPPEKLSVTVAEKKVQHQVKLDGIRGLSPGTTRTFSIRATAEDGRTYDYADKFTIRELATGPADRRRVGTVGQLFFENIHVSASDDSANFSFNATEPATVLIKTSNRPIPEEPAAETPPRITTPTIPVPDFKIPDLSGVGEASVDEHRSKHTINIKPRSRFLTGTTYYYLIVATTEAGRVHQYRGTFQATVDRESRTSSPASRRRRIP